MTTEIELSYGTIAKEDIPIVMVEPLHDKYMRHGSWLSFIVLSMFLVVYLVLNESNKRHKLRNITTQFLMEEFDRRLNLQERLINFKNNLLSVPYTKYIDIYIPVTKSLGTPEQLDNLFIFYVVGKSGAISQVQSQWSIRSNNYYCRFVMPNYMQLYGLIIYFSANKIFARNLDKTINMMNIYLQNQNDDIIWRDTLTMNFSSGDSSVGLMMGNYILVQFDLSKYDVRSSSC